MLGAQIYVNLILQLAIPTAESKVVLFLHYITYHENIRWVQA